MKNLSEREIQSRLYGRIKSEAQEEQVPILTPPATPAFMPPLPKAKKQSSRSSPSKTRVRSSKHTARKSFSKPADPIRVPKKRVIVAAARMMKPVQEVLPIPSPEPSSPVPPPKPPRVLALGKPAASTMTVALAAFAVGFLTLTTGSFLGRARTSPPATPSQNLAKAALDAVRASQPLTIQVAVLNRHSDAEKLVLQLREAGHDAFSMVETNARGNTRYRICMGQFEKREEAETLLALVRERLGFRDSFIRKR